MLVQRNANTVNYNTEHELSRLIAQCLVLSKLTLYARPDLAGDASNRSRSTISIHKFIQNMPCALDSLRFADGTRQTYRSVISYTRTKS